MSGRGPRRWRFGARGQALGSLADGQDADVREILHGLQETGVVLHRVEPRDVGNDRGADRESGARGAPRRARRVGPEPLGIDARIDDPGAAGPVARATWLASPAAELLIRMSA